MARPLLPDSQCSCSRPPQALLCLAAVVGGSRLQQDQLAALSVKALAGSAQPTVPLLQQVLHAAVAGDCPAEQVAADRLLEAFCLGNPAGQSALVGPLLHSSPPAAAPGSFAGLLLQGLGQQGSLGALAASSRAAAALSHLVASNASVQPHLLGVQVAVQQQQQQPRSPQAAGAVALSGNVGLMGLCASHLGALVTQHGRQPASLAAAADTLRLLLVWLHACPPAVTAFLRAVAQSQPFLVDSIRGSNACSSAAASAHPLTRGMLALLLGLCASYAEEGAGTASQQQLLGAICQQIGQPQFLGILDALLQHPAVSGAGGTTSSAGSGSVFGAAPAPSPAFAAFLRELAAEVRQRVTGVAAPPQQHPAAVAPPAPAPTPLQPPPTHLQPPAFHGAPPGANGVPPYSGPHHHKPASPLAVGSPRFLPPGTAASAATPASASPWQPASPRAQPASVPMFSSATAAATALHGHLPAAHGPGTPGALPSSPTPSDMSTQLQLAHARAEALQRWGAALWDRGGGRGRLGSCMRWEGNPIVQCHELYPLPPSPRPAAGRTSSCGRSRRC